MRRRVLTMVILLLTLVGYAQKPDFDINQHISSLIEKGDETENQQYYNLLLNYADNPLDINNATSEELWSLGILSREQINELILHREQTGKILNINELQSLSTFSLTDIVAIRPFLIAANHNTIRKKIADLANKSANYSTLGYSRVLESAIGYSDKKYSGSPDQMQLRVRLRNPGQLSIGLSAQKDPGEPWYTGRAKQPVDFYSGHVLIENHQRIKQFVVGDYRLQFGQGLLAGGGFMVGKNIATVASIKQSTLGITPYSSISEANYFRGTAFALKLNSNLNIYAFYSNQHLDATLVNERTVSSIRTTGLHRTSSEIAAQDQLHEQVWGSAITYTKNKISSGVLIMNTQFDKNIIPPASNYNLYKFSGSQLLNYSWFGQIQTGNFLIFSEVARSNKAGLGLNIGLIGSISKYVSLSMLYRSFATDFYSLYGQPFSERGTIGNENGMYWGLQLMPFQKFTISAYYDTYKFPWLTANTASPSNGIDYLVRAEYTLGDRANMFVQIRNEHAYTNELGNNVLQLLPTKLVKSIINFDYNLQSPFSFRSRFQLNSFTGRQTELGYLICQDINYSAIKFGVSARILLFDTDSFGSRQYVYEKDMLFSYTTRVYIGRGISYYLLIRYKPWRNFAIRAKWSLTAYENQANIGSGNDLIIGNQKTQISAQLHYTF